MGFNTASVSIQSHPLPSREVQTLSCKCSNPCPCLDRVQHCKRKQKKKHKNFMGKFCVIIFSMCHLHGVCFDEMQSVIADRTTGFGRLKVCRVLIPAGNAPRLSSSLLQRCSRLQWQLLGIQDIFTFEHRPQKSASWTVYLIYIFIHFFTFC